jgi:hypothetical protein
MNFFRRRKAPSEAKPELRQMDDAGLEREKTRIEIEKLRIELNELRFWRRKWILTTVLSVAVPVGGIIAFTATWVTGHVAERKHERDDRYNKAVEQLSSPDASVRLNAVATLQSLMCSGIVRSADADPDGCPSESRWDHFWNDVTGTTSVEEIRIRTRDGTAVVVGRLVPETDPAVLKGIANTAAAHLNASIHPVLSLNRSAAVTFARASGDYAGVYILNNANKVSMNTDEAGYEDFVRSAVNAIDAITLRTGSPFEIEGKLNASFVSREFLVQPKCAFREVFRKQRELMLASDLDSSWFKMPPGPADMVQKMDAMEKAAIVLEKSSFVLVSIAQDKEGLSKLLQNDLYGVAIVVGELNTAVADKLRGDAAFVQIFDNKISTCDHKAS